MYVANDCVTSFMNFVIRMKQTFYTHPKDNLIKRFPILSFIALTFFISHIVNPVLVELISILLPNLSFSFPLSQLNSNSLINQYGPGISALIIVYNIYGSNGIQSTMSHCKLNFTFLKWLLLSLFLPLFMILISFCLAGIGLADLLSILVNNWKLYALITGGFILSAGLAEEYGWRGFMLPQLLKNYSPAKATFFIFVIASIWHFPALLSGWKNEPLIPWIILSLSIAVVHSWLFCMSGGNILIAIAFHSCFDAQYSFFSNFIPSNLVEHKPFHQGWTYIILYCVLAFAIILFTKGNLGFTKERLDIDKYFGER